LNYHISDGPHSHDIAILKINSLNSKGVKFDTHVQPICLPDYYTKANDVDWCTVTGWGAQKRMFLSTQLYFHFKVNIQVVLCDYIWY